MAVSLKENNCFVLIRIKLHAHNQIFVVSAKNVKIDNINPQWRHFRF
jgi:hypothetical protein